MVSNAAHTARKSTPTCPARTSRQALTEKKIVCIGTKASNTKDLQQVKELAMNIPNHGYRCLDMNDIALFHEQLLSLGTDGFNHRFSKELFAVKSLDALIQVDTGCCDVSNAYRSSEGPGPEYRLAAAHNILGRPGIATKVSGTA